MFAFTHYSSASTSRCGCIQILEGELFQGMSQVLIAKPGRVITTEVIASLLAKAWPVSCTPVNIMSGFQRSGAFPLNPGEVTDCQMAPSKGFYKRSPNTSTRQVFADLFY